ncbi:GTP-binding protein, putative [Leishmania tarentolae]|uniref:GTP-binding protein, putative n=1 Tax=Leishmania tarentolae TaxID=5689 RepID=A0A640KID8_LEITA|nr:GTP-binding protein, putative [Leishmania tarentolae]
MRRRLEHYRTNSSRARTKRKKERPRVCTLRGGGTKNGSNRFSLVITHRQRRVRHGLLLRLQRGHLLGCKSNHICVQHRNLHQHQIWIVGKLLRQPYERLLEVVVRLGRDIVVLETLLAVESNHLCLHLTVRAVYLVAYQDDGNVVAHTRDIAVPVRHVLVCVAAGDIKHDDGALAFHVVAIAKTTELLLTGSIPAVEADLAAVRVEGQWVHIDTNGSDVALLELASQVSLHESRLTCAAIADEDQLEAGNAVRGRLLHDE